MVVLLEGGEEGEDRHRGVISLKRLVEWECSDFLEESTGND